MSPLVQRSWVTIAARSVPRLRFGLVWTGSILGVGAALDESQGDPFLHDLAFLIDKLPLPGDGPAPAAGTRLFLQHLAQDANGVSDKNGPFELPVPNAQKRDGAHEWIGDAESAGH